MEPRHSHGYRSQARRLSTRGPTLLDLHELELTRAERALRDLWLHILAHPEVFELIGDSIETLIDVCERIQALDLSSSSSSSTSASSSDLDWEHVSSVEPSSTDNTRRRNPRTQMFDPFVTESLRRNMDPYHSDSSSELGAGFWRRTYRRTQPRTQTHAAGPAQPPDAARPRGPSQPFTPERTDPIDTASDTTSASSPSDSQSQHQEVQSQRIHHPANPHQILQGISFPTSAFNLIFPRNRYNEESLQIHPNIREALNGPTTRDEARYGADPMLLDPTDPLFDLHPSLSRSQQYSDRHRNGGNEEAGWGVGLPWWWMGMGN